MWAGYGAPALRLSPLFGEGLGGVQLSPLPSRERARVRVEVGNVKAAGLGNPALHFEPRNFPRRGDR